MKCPACDKRMSCTDSRAVPSEQATRRRYTCICGVFATTKEYVVSTDTEKREAGQRGPQVRLLTAPINVAAELRALADRIEK